MAATVATTLIEIHSVDAFRAKLSEADAANKPVIIDFTATWCGPCRTIGPVFAELSKTNSNAIYFLKVDVDELQELAQQWGVEAMPTFIVIKKGQVVDKVVGADKKKLEALITKYCSPDASAQ